MWTSLCLKELRENAVIAAVALVWTLQWMAGLFGSQLSMLGTQPYTIPFLDNTAFAGFVTCAAVLAAALGFHQTMGESTRQTYLFLLHRPAPRRLVMSAKLAVGLCLLLAFTLGPMLVYLAFAAVPGMHASPFDWEFTYEWWWVVVLAAVFYLGAFLSGLRPARWFVSRLWPLAGTAALCGGVFLLAMVTGWAIVFAAVLAIGLFDQIQHVAATREFP